MRKTNKEKMNFPNMDSLQPVVNIINEASITLGDPTRTIKDSPLIEVFSAAMDGLNTSSYVHPPNQSAW